MAENRIQTLLESLEVFPTYLTRFDKESLKNALKEFPDNMNYYLSGRVSNYPLQGDGWRGFLIYDFESKSELTGRTGLVLSNTCDVNLDNVRDYDKSVIFVPLVPLDSFRELLLEKGIRQGKIDEQYNNFRAQRVTDVFYLPELPGYIPEAIALLDDVHSLPRRVFSDNVDEHVFTLNDYGFYLFLLKLAVHFTRMHEGHSRAAAVEASS